MRYFSYSTPKIPYHERLSLSPFLSIYCTVLSYGLGFPPTHSYSELIINIPLPITTDYCLISRTTRQLPSFSVLRQEALYNILRTGEYLILPME